MFIAALLTIVKIWRQPRCLSTNEWRKKCLSTNVHIYTKKHYSAIKKEILPSAATLMDLEGTMLSEISQTEKGK